jgi:PEP-CTERM motif
MEKTLLTALIALAGLPAAFTQSLVSTLDDIAFWTGEGPNRAALVIQWNDGISPGSLAWGYRWSGNSTGLDMINAIAGNTTVSNAGGGLIESQTGADSRLALGVVRYSFGDSIFSIDYSGSDPARTQADWESGYWEYLIFGGDFEYYNWGDSEPSFYNTPGSAFYSSVNWFSSPIGMGDRVLVDGSWDALSFAPGFAGQAVVQPVAVAVPEPSALGLMGLGGLLLIYALRRIFAC